MSLCFRNVPDVLSWSLRHSHFPLFDFIAAQDAQSTSRILFDSLWHFFQYLRAFFGHCGRTLLIVEIQVVPSFQNEAGYQVWRYR